MSTITHYGVRDLHADSPGDYPGENFDVVCKTEDGRFFYSEDLFCSESDAELFVCQMQWEPYPLESWMGSPCQAHTVESVKWWPAIATPTQE